MDKLTLVRKRIGDSAKTDTEEFPLDDTTTTIQLNFENVTIVTVHISESETPLEINTDYLYESSSGTITLLETPPPNSKLMITYTYYAFTDNELNTLITNYGVNGACVEAIRWLIADSSRLHDYSRGATSESLSQIMSNLQTMLKDYRSLADTEDGKPAQDMFVGKRTNQYYRGTRDIPYDLSRDDSLNN